MCKSLCHTRDVYTSLVTQWVVYICLLLFRYQFLPIYRQLHKNQITLYIERHCVQKITGLKFLNLIFWIISNCIFFYSLFFRIFFVEGSSFQRIMAMCNRQLVFDKLRPLCVQLSKDHSRKNVVAVTKALEGIDRGCIQDLQEYLLFPLRIILKQPTK